MRMVMRCDIASVASMLATLVVHRCIAELHMSVADEVFAVLEEVTGESAVRANPSIQLFEQFLLDSFRFITLLAALNERLHTDVALSEIEWAMWATPAQIVTFMEQRLVLARA